MSQTLIAPPSIFYFSQVEEHHKIKGQEGSRSTKVHVYTWKFINQQGIDKIQDDFRKITFKWIFIQYEIDLVNFFVYDLFWFYE